ncbi:acetyl-coenzyme A carboxylase carboxyl transferase subunit alpha, chloroplastic [Vigna umbellata]|uniref:acetyl-coenzyme A carboxylase carboxyl transferase subunit alpha, chloroplastic n=1 Tax=Vigna umbellata TaxID=87088 RepID=UPI001F5FB5D3|nr:acetyl-coenzyme A carboxylase carboxyl transferase subunit alpha, chloroplastic [Vigna umbellata]
MAASSASLAGASASLAGASASDLLRSSTSGFNGVPLRSLGKGRLVVKSRDFSVAAKLRKVKKYDYPWPANPDPNVKGGLLTHLSYFKPLKEKPKPATLDFEKPLVDLQKKIFDVQKMADETGLDFADQIQLLETKYQQALKDLYTHLTPIQRVHIARHPNRPTFLDHIFNITEKFMEIHGDRAGYDDPAIVTGIGLIDGRRYMFIGHQKGRNTKENIQRNFGMPTPHGYRKALRLMEYADHHGFPIVTFIDTPGAYADLKSEEEGQGEAIAHNLRSMFGLKVPVISIVIGEGGSGGALAIGCANKLLMLENAVFYVASPEACAAILWKSAKAAPKAAEKLRITAPELCKLQVADGIIPEPLGGAHANPEWTSQQIKKAINDTMDELTKMDTEELIKHRMLKFRKIGGFQEGIPIDPKRKVKMRKKDLSITKMPDAELQAEVQKLKKQILEAKESSPIPPKLDLDEMLKQLEKEINQEYTEAIKAAGLTERLLQLQEEVSAANADHESLDPSLKDKVDKLRVEFEKKLRAYPNHGRLQKYLKYFSELSEAKKLSGVSKDTVTFKQELKTTLDQVLSNPRLKKEFEALKDEIRSVGASSGSGLDEELKKKITDFKKEVDSQMVTALKSMGLDVAVKQDKATDPGTEELKEEIVHQIDSLVNSSEDIKNKMQLLKSEVAKAGKSPSSESQNKIDALVQQIKRNLAEVIGSSGLKEQYEALLSNGSLDSAADRVTDEEAREHVGANSTIS